MEQEQIGEQIIGVPGVFRCAAFVAAVFQFAPVQAVVLDVVDDLQLSECDHALNHEKDNPRPAEGATEACRD